MTSPIMRKTPDPVMVILGILIGVFGGGAMWHFISDKHYHIALWICFSVYVLFGLLVTFYIRNSIIDRTNKLKNNYTKTETISSEKNGLTFKEVSPPELGLPDTFTVDFGSNTGTVLRSVLEEKVPFEKLSNISIGGEIPVRIFFDKNENLKIDATIYDSTGEIAVVIKENNFSILNVKWDRNWDKTAFEIVDENKIPIFQIERPKPNFIKLRGIFITDKGSVLVSTDSGININPPKLVSIPNPIFLYPSANNLNKRITSLP